MDAGYSMDTGVPIIHKTGEISRKDCFHQENASLDIILLGVRVHLPLN